MQYSFSISNPKSNSGVLSLHTFVTHISEMLRTLLGLFVLRSSQTLNINTRFFSFYFAYDVAFFMSKTYLVTSNAQAFPENACYHCYKEYKGIVQSSHGFTTL